MKPWNKSSSFLFKLCLYFICWSIILITSTRSHASAHSYTKIQTKDPQTIHILKIDPTQVKLIAAKADYEGQTVSDLVKSHHAIAGINAGFFHDNHAPSGALKINGEWLSTPVKHRGAIGWSNNTFKFDRILTETTIQTNNQTYIIKGKNIKNQYPVIYTENVYFRSPKLPNSIDWIIQNDNLLQKYRFGNLYIPTEGAILKLDRRNKLPFAPGDKLSYQIRILTDLEKAKDWEHLKNIVGGTPLLIYKGKPITDFSKEQMFNKFEMDRHARSAICLTKDKHILLVVVDGKRPKYSLGMTLVELRNFLMSQNCEYALNLDGGGSSALVYQNKLMNRPHDQYEDDANNIPYQYLKERKVANAILVLNRKLING